MKFKKPLLLAVLFISMIMLTACTKTDNGMVYEDATARAATDDGVAENVTDDTTVDAADDATDDAAVDAAANAQIENAPNENEQSESGKQENDQVADEEKYMKLYAPVMHEMLDVIQKGYDFDKEYPYVSNALIERVMYADRDAVSKNVGYLLMDVNGDGILELLIGENINYETDDLGQRCYVYSCYTIKDEKPVAAFMGMTRSSFEWIGDGQFYYLGSGGAYDTLFGLAHLSDDGANLVWEDFYFTAANEDMDGVCIYHNTEGVYDADKSEKLDISEEEFSEIVDEAYKQVLLTWNPINQYTGNEKSDLSGENAAGLTKEEMAEIAEGLGNVCVSEYRDFDQDGMYEEFVATGEPDEMGGYLVDAVWFIGSDGTTTKVGTDFKGLSLYESQNGYFMDYSEEGKGFFYADCGGYGSGWLTFVFGVKDGKPYELDISMKIQGFYQDEPGIFTTTTDDFTEYHKYLITELNYDKNTEQFDIGKVTDQDRYGE